MYGMYLNWGEKGIRNMGAMKKKKGNEYSPVLFSEIVTTSCFHSVIVEIRSS